MVIFKNVSFSLNSIIHHFDYMSSITTPTITVSKKEVQISKLTKSLIPHFPSLLGVNGFKKVIDPVSGVEINIPRLERFDEIKIQYIVRDLPIADYIINSESGKISVIKRMTMEDIATFWTRNGKRMFRQIFTDLRKSFVDVDIYFIIEGYYRCIFDTTSNVIWIMWRFDESKKKVDKAGNPRMANASFTKYNIRPSEIEYEIKKLDNIGICVMKTTDAEGVMNHLKNFIYDIREGDHDEKEEGWEIIYDLFPFLSIEACQSIMKKGKNVFDAINLISMCSSVDDLGIDSVSKEDILKMRKILGKK